MGTFVHKADKIKIYITFDEIQKKIKTESSHEDHIHLKILSPNDLSGDDEAVDCKFTRKY